MADYEFNTPENQTVARDMMLMFLNTGTKTEPVWSPVGYRVEDSSMNLDWQKTSSQDIMGQIYNTMKKPVKTQPFTPWPLVNGDAAQKRLWRLGIVEEDAQALCNQDVLVLHKYAGDLKTGVLAIRNESCSIEITSFGGPGGGNLEMPINVTYGGTRTVGIATVAEKVVTFIPETT